MRLKEGNEQPGARNGRRRPPDRGGRCDNHHRGPFTALASAHRDVLDWCAEQGRRPVGPRWEVYGPHHDDPGELRTEIYYLLS